MNYWIYWIYGTDLVDGKEFAIDGGTPGLHDKISVFSDPDPGKS